MSSPGSDKPFLLQWMFSPTMQEDGRIILLQDAPRATLKTISFFNAYCVGLQTVFMPGDNAGGSLQMQVRLSPQRVAVGVIVHDNNWPLESHGAGQSFARQEVPVKKAVPSAADREPGLFSTITHTVLDVAGLVPVIGEVADGANALYYLAEGNQVDAALSAAAMIPLAGMAATGGKLLRKGVKVAQEAKGLKKAFSSIRKSKGIIIRSGQAFGDVRKAKFLREIKKGEKIVDIVEEAKLNTFYDNVEHAVIKAGDGKRYMVSGGRHGIELPADTKVLYGHTHPNVGSGHINTPSIADREALDKIKQPKQYIYHDGQRTTIHRGDREGFKDVTLTNY